MAQGDSRSQPKAADKIRKARVAHPRPKPEDDPLLALRGSGRELWADEHADEYVRRLREWP